MNNEPIIEMKLSQKDTAKLYLKYIKLRNEIKLLKKNQLLELFTECTYCGGIVNIDEINCCCETCGIEITCYECGEEYHISTTIGPKEN